MGTCRPWTAATASGRRSPCWCSAWRQATRWRARCCARHRASFCWSVVMKKGAFLQERGEEKKASMNSDELLDLLQSDISKDDIAQSGVVSDKDLARLLD